MKTPMILALAASLAACTATVPGQDPVGERFPEVSGEDLNGKAVALLDPSEPRILLVGYEQRTQFDIDRWILGLQQTGTPAPLVEVPTIPGLLPGMASGYIDDGMRGGIPPEDWALVVTLYGSDASTVAAFTGNELGNNARVLLLDANDRVAWFHDRGYSASLVMDLDRAFRELVEAGGVMPPPETITTTETTEAAAMQLSILPETLPGAPTMLQPNLLETAPDPTVGPLLFDFMTAGREGAWMTVDDRVMGGRSRSSLVLGPRGGAAFQGNFVLQGGGFASVRSMPRLPMDLSSYTAIELLVRGDGRTYQMRLRDRSSFDGISWRSEFNPKDGHWQVVRIPIELLEPTFRGRIVRNAEPLKVDSIKTFGLMLADGGDGAFNLDLRWIRAVTD